jgi:hypothetical protein
VPEIILINKLILLIRFKKCSQHLICFDLKIAGEERLGKKSNTISDGKVNS